MSQPFLGMIIVVGFNFAPRGWAFCNGQLLPIVQNTALFSLLGTTYGGNGQTTFALPDLRGRVPVHAGQGPGLSPYVIGQAGGQENVTLQSGELPPHAHVLDLAHNPPNSLMGTGKVKSAAGNSQTPVGNVPAIEAAGVTATYSNAAPDAAMAIGSISVSGSATTDPAGSGLPVPILPPYLTFNYIIALQGIFPSRN